MKWQMSKKRIIYPCIQWAGDNFTDIKDFIRYHCSYWEIFNEGETLILYTPPLCDDVPIRIFKRDYIVFDSEVGDPMKYEQEEFIINFDFHYFK